MWGIFNPDNKFIRFLEGVYNLILLSLLWSIAALTVVGVGPASTALYYAVSKSIKRGRSYPGREFFHALKNNWWKSILGGLLLMIFFLSAYFVDFPYISEWIVYGTSSNMLMLILALVKLFFMFGIIIYFFPILSRFEVGAGKALSVSVILIFRHLFSTILLTVLILISIFIVMTEPISVLLVPGLYTFLSTYPIEWIMQKYMMNSDKEMDNSRDQWYLEN